MVTLDSLMPPREPSGLGDAGLATAASDTSDRMIGSITKVVRAVTVAALRQGAERISPATLRQVDITPLSGFKSEEV